MMTVIILLILAGVTISLVIGKNGLIAKSKESVDKYKDKAKEEQWQLEDFEAGMEELKDEEENPELKQMKLVLNITEDNKEIQLPVYTYSDDYKYDCTVNWGDGIIEQVTNENAKTKKHTYENTGEYTVVIEGTYESLYYNSSIQTALKKIEQWGVTGVKNIYLEDCANLEEIAEPSKNSFVNVADFDRTFSGCSGLTSIPENLFANCPNVTNFWLTFCRCSNLTNMPERLFANCSNVTSFDWTFEKCSGLTNIPERLFANCLNVIRFNGVFSECRSLISVPEKLFYNCQDVTNFNSIFLKCTNLVSVPEKLFANCSNVTSFEHTFEECSSLRSIPERLYANCTNVTSFYRTFAYCTELRGKSIHLWEEGRSGIDKNSGGEACYYMCEKLEDYSQIPSYWAKEPRSNVKSHNESGLLIKI